MKKIIIKESQFQEIIRILALENVNNMKTINETQIEIPTEKVEYNSFDEWVDSIPLDDEYVFESWEFYDNPRNIKQNPEQKRDEQGRLIEYKEDSQKLVSWGELKQEMKNLYAEQGNVYELGLEHGYPYGSTNTILDLGNASKYYFSMRPEGSVSLKSKNDGHFHEWDNFNKVGNNGWTRDNYRGYHDNISSGRLD